MQGKRLGTSLPTLVGQSAPIGGKRTAGGREQLALQNSVIWAAPRQRQRAVEDSTFEDSTLPAERASRRNTLLSTTVDAAQCDVRSSAFSDMVNLRHGQPPTRQTSETPPLRHHL